MEEFCSVDILPGYSQSSVFSLGEKITGEVVIVPKVDLDIDSLEFNVVTEAKGKMATQTVSLIDQVLTNHVVLHQDKEYRYPVEFTNSTIPSYKGKNASIMVKAEVYANLHKEQKKELNPGLLKNSFLGRLVGSDEKFKTSRYLNFSIKNPTYEIVSREINLTSKKNLLIGAIVVFIFLGVGLGILFSHIGDVGGVDFWVYLLIGIPAIILTVIAYNLIMKKVIGDVVIQFENLREGKFKQVLKNEKRWFQVKKAEVSFEVKEEVIDDRGTSSSTYTNSIFKSPIETFEYPNSNLHVEFDFPQNMPFTFKQGNVRVYWDARLKVYSRLGLPITLKSEFEVAQGDQVLT